MFGAIVLDVDRGPEALDGGARAGDDIVLHAFDIDLEEPQPRKSQAVDCHQLHLVALPTPSATPPKLSGRS